MKDLIKQAEEIGFESERVKIPIDCYDKYYVPWIHDLRWWLNVEYDIWIYVVHWDGEWQWNHQHIKMCYNGDSKEGFKAPVLALEAGLSEALKLITNK